MQAISQILIGGPLGRLSGPVSHRLSVLLCGLALALALPLSLGSLVSFGTWSKAELLPLWLHSAAALGSLGLAIGVVSRCPAAGDALRSPLVLLPAALGMWSVLMAPTTALPLLSLSGAIQSGHGAFWFLDCAALIASGLVLRQTSPGLWRCLILWSVLVAATVAVLKAIDFLDPNQHLLIFVPAYYGWIGLALAAVAMTLRRPDGTADIPRRIAVLVVAVALLVVAKSITAAGMTGIAALYAGLVHLKGRFRPLALLDGRVVPVLLITVTAFLPYLLLRWVPDLGHSESLRDRQLLQQMMHAALASQDAIQWVTGNGWGQIQDAFRTNLNVTGETLWNPTWIFLTSDYFHPHNWILESLHAAGLPGALLFFAGLISLPLFADHNSRVIATGLALSVTAMYSLWFDISVSVPFYALAVAALSAPPRVRATPLPRAIAALPAVHALAAVGWTVTLAGFILTVQAVRSGHSGTFPLDPRGNDITLTEVLRQDIGPGLLRPEARTGTSALIERIEDRIPQTNSAYFLVNATKLYDQIFLTGDLKPLAGILRPDNRWKQAIERLLLIAPGRTDAAIGYLTYQAVQGQIPEVERLTAKVLATTPLDPVGLYFKGLTQVLRPEPASKAYGISLLRQSKTYGIERFMPLDPQILSLIQSAP